MRDVRGQLDGLRKRVCEGRRGRRNRCCDAAKALDDKMTAVEEALYQTKNRSPQDPLNFPVRLNDKLAAVAGSAAVGDSAPTAAGGPGQGRADRRRSTPSSPSCAEVWSKDLPAFNELARTKGVPAVDRTPAPSRLN